VVQGANDLHMVQLMPMPPHPLMLHLNPDWLPTCPRRPGKEAVKWVSVCTSVVCLAGGVFTRRTAAFSKVFHQVQNADAKHVLSDCERYQHRSAVLMFCCLSLSVYLCSCCSTDLTDSVFKSNQIYSP